MQTTIALALLLCCQSVLAELTVRYSRVKGGNGSIRAEIMTEGGRVVGTGYSKQTGSRKNRKDQALDEALDDAEKNIEEGK